MVKLSIETCKRLAKEHGGECLSDEYCGYKNKYLWKCSFGHTWNATLDGIKNKNAWCPKCANEKLSRMKSLDDGIGEAKALAKNNGGKCLSDEYTNMYVKLKWKCKNGHIWEAGLTNIKHKKQWCPFCCKRPPLSIKDCIKVAKINNGKCLSKSYKNCEELLEWECDKGHTWKASLKSIRLNKSWCPRCMVYKSQYSLAKILCGILNYKCINNFRGFGWLKNPKTNRKLEIDIWFPDIKLAIEYDGEQHFEPRSLFGGKNELIKTKNRDKIKNHLIASRPDEIKYFIRISYKDELSIENIKQKLQMVGIKC